MSKEMGWLLREKVCSFEKEQREVKMAFEFELLFKL